MASPGYGSRPAPDNDIYTILVAAAMAIVIGALVFVCIKSTDLIGVPVPSFVS